MTIRFEGRTWDMPRSPGELERLIARVLGFSTLPGPIWKHLEDNAFVTGAMYPRNRRGVIACLAEARSFLRSHPELAKGSIPERMSSTMRVPRSLMPPASTARARLFSEHVAQVARQDSDLQRTRTGLLKGRLIAPDRVASFLSSPAIQMFSAADFEANGTPLFEHESQFIDVEQSEAERSGIATKIRVTWPNGMGERPCAEDWFGDPRRRVPAIADDGHLIWHPARKWSVLDDIGELAETLARRHPWELQDAVVFILSDKSPEIRPVSVRNSALWTHNYHRGLVTIVVEPWVSVRHVAAIYQKAQREKFAATPKQCGDDALALFQFVARRTASSKKRPSMAKLMAAWNRSHRNHQFGDYRHFRRSFLRAERWVEQILFPRYRIFGHGGPSDRQRTPKSDALPRRRNTPKKRER